MRARGQDERTVTIDAAGVELQATLGAPPGARGVVVFAHGSGSSRHSSRNRYVASELRAAGLATLLLDLLTAEEEEVDLRTRHLRFDIGLLAGRVAGAVGWVLGERDLRARPLGLFGASTGAAAALAAAAELPDDVAAVVSRGGRPDLAGDSLLRVRAPTLLIVGGDDVPVIGMNREAMGRMGARVELAIVPGASHLFEEPGTLEQVARLAADWFGRHLGD